MSRDIDGLLLACVRHDPAPPREPGTQGRPRLKGKCRPTLEVVWADDDTEWTPLKVDQGYGEGPREIAVATDTAVGYHAGKTPVAIRWVLIRNPQERFKAQALLSTTLDHTAEQIVTWFGRRWTDVLCRVGRWIKSSLEGRVWELTQPWTPISGSACLTQPQKTKRAAASPPHFNTYAGASS